MSWLIPGTLAAVLAFATSFITLGPPPTAPVKTCTQVAVLADHRINISDCEGAR